MVGFMSMLQAWFVLLDMGLSPTVTREMSRFVGGGRNTESMRDLLRSLELIGAGIAVVVGLAIWLLAPYIAKHWLNVDQLPIEQVITSIVLIGLILAVRLLEQIYRGALQGLQAHVWLSAVQAIMATLRWGGAMLVIAFVAPTIVAFFIWQAAISLVTVVVFCVRTYFLLPRPERAARFSVPELKGIQRFAGGMVGITVVTLLLTQVDKLLLSALLPLEEFGLFMLCVAVAGGLSFLVMPLSVTILPRFTQLVTQQDSRALVSTYHDASQLVAVILIPAALVMAVFSEELLWSWSGNQNLVNHGAPLLTLLALGTLFNGFMHVPYALQLAHGWTSLTLKVNTIAVVILVPSLLLAVPAYGMIAAGWVWLILNFCYVVFAVHFMYRRLLPQEKWRWYWNAVLKPLAIGASTLVLLNMVKPYSQNRIILAIMLVVFTCICAAAVAITLPIIQRKLFIFRSLKLSTK